MHNVYLLYHGSVIHRNYISFHLEHSDFCHTFIPVILKVTCTILFLFRYLINYMRSYKASLCIQVAKICKNSRTNVMFVREKYPFYSIPTILTSISAPFGKATRTSSFKCLPIKLCAIGDSLEILPLNTSASAEPTIL